MNLPERCWADIIVQLGYEPTLMWCGADAVYEGLCAPCYRSIFGKNPPPEGGRNRAKRKQ